MIADYDPNEAASLGTVHVYEVTFQAWKSRAIYEVEVGGNVIGLGLFESAVSRIYDHLPERANCHNPCLVLTDADGESHIVEEGYSGEADTMGERWLHDMVVSIVLVEVRRVLPGMYPSEMAKAGAPRRVYREGAWMPNDKAYA